MEECEGTDLNRGTPSRTDLESAALGLTWLPSPVTPKVYLFLTVACLQVHHIRVASAPGSIGGEALDTHISALSRIKSYLVPQLGGRIVKLAIDHDAYTIDSKEYFAATVFRIL